MYNPPNISGSLYGGMGQTIPTMPAPPMPRNLDTLSERLGEACKRASDLRDRARLIADDVFGSNHLGNVSNVITFTNGQSTIAYTTATTAPPGRAERLHDAVRDLNDTLSALSTEIDRLTCL